MRRIKIRKFPPLQIFVYLLIRYFEILLNTLSYKKAFKVSKIIASIFYYVDPAHRILAKDNVLKAGVASKEGNDAEILVKKVYENFALLLVETLLFRRIMRRKEVDKLVKIENAENLNQVLKHGKGAILVVAHLGNWEIGGIALSKQGFPLSSVARPLTNSMLNSFLVGVRTREKQVIIGKYNASQRMAAELKANRLLALLVDQHAGSKGIWVDFFGRPASTVKSAAILSLRYGSPIVPIKVFRENGYHKLVVADPILPSSELSVEQLTQIYTKRIEKFIRENPEQWLWLHKRWKTPPERHKAMQNPEESKVGF